MQSNRIRSIFYAMHCLRADRQKFKPLTEAQFLELSMKIELLPK
jgi:hypothetical protein